MIDVSRFVGLAIASAQSGDVEPLRAWIEAHENDADARDVLADAPKFLQQLAQQYDRPQTGAAAYAMVDAAVLLAPRRLDLYTTRMLVGMTVGRIAQSRADAALLVAEGHPQGGLLGAYLDALFPRGFDLSPIAFPRETPPSGVKHARCVRSPEAVRRQLGKYAARLAMARERLLTLGAAPDADWLVPELSVPVVALDDAEKPDEAGLRDWQLAALADAAGLRALWGALGGPGIPEPLPEELGDPLAWAQFWLWRARGQQTSGGQVARSSGLPSFSWSGFDIAAAHPLVARALADQVAEVQAALSWLTDAGVESVWQDGLRDS